MKLKISLTLVTLLFVTLSLDAQDLKSLRIAPDTSFISESKDESVSIRNVEVPIPQLGLTVNYWKHWSKFGINLNQASFSDNWRDGGVNSVAWSSTLWHKSEYAKNDFTFMTEFDLRYGKIQNQDQLSKKNVDRIFWDNKLNYSISRNWSLFTSVSFESIFDNGYSYARDEDNFEYRDKLIAAFFSPAYLTQSLGLEYKVDKTFSLLFGTGTARQTFVLNDSIPYGNPDAEGIRRRYGVEEGKTMRNELGFQLVANLDRNLSKNLNIKSRLRAIADYQKLGSPDVRWDATLTARVTSLVSVTLNGTLWYDPTRIMEGETDARVQYSQALALGFLFALPK